MESIKHGLKDYATKKDMVNNAQKVLLGSSDVKPEKSENWQPWRTHLLFHKKRTGEPVTFFLAWKLLREGELARQRVGWSFDVFRSSRYCHRVLRRQKPDESSFFRLLPLFRRRAQRAAVSVAQSAFHSLGGIKTSLYDFYRFGPGGVDVYFCPHISGDVSKELIFAPHSLSSSWCFRNVK